MKLSKRTLANRENAKKSCGPVTVQGKWRSSQNARTHGLTCKAYSETHKDDGNPPKDENGQPIDELQILIDLYIADLEPGTQPEFDLARSLATLQWQLRRADAYMEVFTKNLQALDPMYVFKAFENFTRQQARVQRIYNQTLEQFHQVKEDRIDARQAKLDNATLFYKLLMEHEHPAAEDWDPRKNGFDFSLDEVRRNLGYHGLQQIDQTPYRHRESTIEIDGVQLVKPLPPSDFEDEKIYDE